MSDAAQQKKYADNPISFLNNACTKEVIAEIIKDLQIPLCIEKSTPEDIASLISSVFSNPVDIGPAARPSKDRLSAIKRIKKCYPKFGLAPGAIVNQTIEKYLRSHPANPKLLLGCGQNYYGYKDVKHDHHDWYTIDTRYQMEPNFIANLNAKECWEYLGKFKNSFNIVFPEYLPFDVAWTADLLKTGYQCLKPGGYYLNITRDVQTNIQLLKDAGLKEHNIQVYQYDASTVGKKLDAPGKHIKISKVERKKVLDSIDPSISSTIDWDSLRKAFIVAKK